MRVTQPGQPNLGSKWRHFSGADMKRKERHEPEWAVDEETALVRDAEMAELYGFRPDDITAARHDLETFSWTYYNNPFETYEKSSKSIEKINKKLTVTCNDLCKINMEVNSSLLGELVEELRSTATRLEHIRAKLPRRPHSLEETAATYPMAFWFHVERAADYSGRRDVVNSFNGDDPIHPSMKFVVEMLGRSNDSLLRHVSASTLKRAQKKFRKARLRPNEVYFFKGDPTFLT